MAFELVQNPQGPSFVSRSPWIIRGTEIKDIVTRRVSFVQWQTGTFRHSVWFVSVAQSNIETIYMTIYEQNIQLGL